MNTLLRLAEKNQILMAIVGFSLVLVVGVVDVLTGYELAFSLFYLLPVATSTWFGGKKMGVATTIACALSWFAADTISAHPYSHPAIPYWNTAIRFSVFLIVSLLIAALRKAYEREKDFANNDNLTGAVNARSFKRLLQTEIDRSQRNRQPFTVAYMDLDNFKAVNDSSGHSMGDRVLCATVQQARALLRKVDVVARLGGDEFALLLPETDHLEAQVVIAKIQKNLLAEMRLNKWPVTFSIGVLTCMTTPSTTDELIKQADILMYQVKKGGKNSIRYAEYADRPMDVAAQQREQ